MNFTDYAEREHRRYEAFAKVVARIIEAALAQEHPQYRIWQVHSRAKGLKSLEDKLSVRGLTDHQNIESQIKDIAGCRLVFYSNQDVDRFLRSSLVADNFDVDWANSKIHQPPPGTQEATELYRARHYLVTLKEARASLPEYANFAGLRCEIQVQTILNHAWSETGHDVIYKPFPTNGFGASLHEKIKKRMARIMNEYLLKAGHEFDAVLRDYDRLSQGKALVESDTAQLIEQAPDNNERHEILDRFKDYVLPHLDDIQTGFQDVLSIVTRAIELARTSPKIDISTPFGTIPGKTVEHVTDIALDTIDYIRYVDVDAVFDTLCFLYVGAESDGERERILKSVERIAENNISVWRRAGPHVQSVVIQKLERLDDRQLKKIMPIAIKACDEVLKSEMEGTSSTYDTITISFAPLPCTDDLKVVRQRALKILKRMFQLVDDDDSKRKIIGAFDNAMRQPGRGEYSDELLGEITNSAADIYDFYTSNAERQSFEVLQTLEHGALWRFRHADWADRNDIAESARAACRRLTASVLAFRDHINKDNTFVRYKTLVGFESVFPPAWDEDVFDINGIDDYRQVKIRQLVEGITEQNAEEWFLFIKRCAQTTSNDGATFPSFGRFLERLAEVKPEIAISYIQRNDPDISGFLTSLLLGLSKSANKASANELIQGWLGRGEHLLSISRYYRADPSIAVANWADLLDAAIAKGDKGAVIDTAAGLTEKHNPENAKLARTLFANAMRFFIANEITGWFRPSWFLAAKSTLLTDLNEDEVRLLLDSIALHPKIDHQAERLLSVIARQWTSLVLEFFHARITHEVALEVRDGGDPYGEHFEPIPYKFYDLPKSFSAEVPSTVATVRSWYEESKKLFEFRGGRLLANLFPTLTAAFEQELISLVARSHVGDIDFVLAVLRNYDDGTSTQNVLKEIVKILPGDAEELGEVSIILQSTGTVAGEYGFVEAYKRKKQEIEHWLADVDEKVRRFTSRYMDELDRMIAVELHRAEADIERRKRDYDNDDEGK